MRLAVVLQPEDGSPKRTGFREKVLALIELFAGYGEVDVLGGTLPRDLITQHRNVTSATIAKRRFGRSAYSMLCYRLFRGRYDYVLIPTMFHPMFPMLFIVAKLAGSRVVYRMGDPLARTIRNMRYEVARRVHSKHLLDVVVGLASIAEWLVLNLCDYVITVSPSLEGLANHLTGSRKRIFLIYNYVKSDVQEPEEFCSAYRALLEHDKTILFYFGHIQPQIRGLEFVLQALARLDESFHFVMMGEVQREEYFRDLIGQSHLESRVTILSSQPKQIALSYLRRACCSVIGPHPSFALPGKLFDSFHVGVPLVLPNSMTDAVSLFRPCSLVYDSTDTESLADACRRVRSARTGLSKVMVEMKGDAVITPFSQGITAALDEILK